MRALVSVLAAAFPFAAPAAPVARVNFAVGEVTAVAPNGQTRPLARGVQVEEGETVATQGGRVQLQFSDGAYVSLQPQSEFRIDQYRYAGREDGNEKGFFSLIRGGLRTITGIVGRNNRKNYQITTAVATIGIRGTEFTIQYGSSVSGTVGEGEIEVCNGGGCLNVANGESYYVQNQDIKPVVTEKKTDLPPAPPETGTAGFAEGDSTNSSGTPCAIAGKCGTTPLTSVNVAVTQANILPGAAVTLQTGATMGSGGLVDFNDGSPPALANLQSPSGRGSDALIAWGTALGASGGLANQFSQNDPLHWVVGFVPTSIAALGGTNASYALLGATLPTGVNDRTIGGTLDSAFMTVSFGSTSSSVSGSMNWTLEGQAIAGTFGGTFSGGALSATGSVGASGLLSVQGIFSGANAERAGLVYDLSSVPGLLQGYVGAAVLDNSSGL